MLKRAAVLAIVLVLLCAALVSADQLKPNDYCFAVLGFEGDGGPIFVIADEKVFRKTGELVGPPASIVPPGFIVSPYSDVTFEYRGTIVGGRNALTEAGFKECQEIAP
jgi:hypothetical protein